MRKILILVSLFGFFQRLPTTAATVTTVAAPGPHVSTTSLGPTTNSSHVESSASTSALKTSPTSARPTTTWSLIETTTSSPSSTNSTTQPGWTVDMALIVAIPTVVGFIILVVVIIVVVCLVVRSRNRRKIARLVPRQPVAPNRYEDKDPPPGVSHSQDVSKIGSEVPNARRHPDREEIYSNNPEGVNGQTGYLSTRPSDVYSHDSVYANQSDFRDERIRRPDSSYLNANDIEMLNKQKDKSGRQNVSKTKKEVPWTSPDNDDDLYLNHVEFSRPTGNVSTAAGTANGRSDDDSRDSIYANDIEMRDEGRRNPRPESADSCNYLNANDMEMLKNARPNLPSLYAP